MFSAKEILDQNLHRPWQMPKENWKYYQEWNNAVFLHWQVDYSELRKLVPARLELDLFEGKPWVSLVAFTMEKIRPAFLPAFPPVSNFHEINIRTYVICDQKPGVHFLSIEGAKWFSCFLAKSISALPYRHSTMKRTTNLYQSKNNETGDHLEIEYYVSNILQNKSPLDAWLTERYALFQHSGNALNEFEIHHIEWPIQEIDIKNLSLNYTKYKHLIDRKPDKTHYSSGVQVLAWGKKKK